MNIRNKVFKRTKELMDTKGFDFTTAEKQAEKELDVLRYEKEIPPESPEFQGIRPMSFEELLARKNELSPKIGTKKRK